VDIASEFELQHVRFDTQDEFLEVFDRYVLQIVSTLYNDNARRLFQINVARYRQHIVDNYSEYRCFTGSAGTATGAIIMCRLTGRKVVTMEYLYHGLDEHD
jgi:hypothetical protein